MDRQVFLEVDVKGQQLVTQAVQQYASRLKLQRCLQNTPTLPAPQREALLQQIKDLWPVHANTRILNRPVREWYRERQPAPVTPPAPPPKQRTSQAEKALLGLSAVALGAAAGVYLRDDKSSVQSAVVAEEKDVETPNECKVRTKALLQRIGKSLDITGGDISVDTIKAQIDVLQEKNTYTEVIKTTMDTLERKFDAYKADMDRESTIATLKKKVNELTVDKTDKDDKLRKLERMIDSNADSVMAELSQCQSKLLEMTNKCVKLSTCVDTLTSQISKKEDDLKTTKEEVEKLTKKNKRKDQKLTKTVTQGLEKQTNASKDKCKSLEAENSELSRRLAAMGEEVSKAEKQAKEATANAKASTDADDTIRGYINHFNRASSEIVDDKYSVVKLIYYQLQALIPNSIPQVEDYQTSDSPAAIQAGVDRVISEALSKLELELEGTITLANLKKKLAAAINKAKVVGEKQAISKLQTCQAFGKITDWNDNEIENVCETVNVQTTDVETATKYMNKCPGLFPSNGASITDRVSNAGQLYQRAMDRISKFIYGNTSHEGKTLDELITGVESKWNIDQWQLYQNAHQVAQQEAQAVTQTQQQAVQQSQQQVTDALVVVQQMQHQDLAHQNKFQQQTARLQAQVHQIRILQNDSKMGQTELTKLRNCSEALVTELNQSDPPHSVDALCDGMKIITQKIKKAVSSTTEAFSILNRTKTKTNQPKTVLDYVISRVRTQRKRTECDKCDHLKEILTKYRSLFQPPFSGVHDTLESLFDKYTFTQVELFITLIPNTSSVSVEYKRPNPASIQYPFELMKGVLIDGKEFDIDKHSKLLDQTIKMWKDMQTAAGSTVIPYLIRLLELFNSPSSQKRPKTQSTDPPHMSKHRRF